jgi:bla regulator protein blaR1
MSGRALKSPRPPIVAVLTLTAGLLSAQTPTPRRFDVASVKPNQSKDETASFVTPGGRYVATNVTVRTLIKSAYGLHDTQLIGGPKWIETDGFDVEGKAQGFTTAAGFRDAARLMLRPLLADRFKLVLRSESRRLPVYALVLARADRQLGPQLHRSSAAACSGAAVAMPTAPQAAEPEIALPCGAEVYRPGHVAARAMALSNLVLNLSRWTDRVVIDGTGLQGPFDWEIQWSPEPLSPDHTGPVNGPSLVDAINEQAYLRLQPTRETVDVLVVERVERPDPD